MKILVLGAGVIGTSTAWYLTEQGHEAALVFGTVPAGWAFVQVPLDVGRKAGGQLLFQEVHQLLADPGAIGGAHRPLRAVMIPVSSACSYNSVCISRRARNSRDFTVPTGIARAWAISA